MKQNKYKKPKINVKNFNISWDNHMSEVNGLPGFQTISFDFVVEVDGVTRRYYANDLRKDEFNPNSGWGVEEL